MSVIATLRCADVTLFQMQKDYSAEIEVLKAVRHLHRASARLDPQAFRTGFFRPKVNPYRDLQFTLYNALSEIAGWRVSKAANDFGAFELLVPLFWSEHAVDVPRDVLEYTHRLCRGDYSQTYFLLESAASMVGRTSVQTRRACLEERHVQEARHQLERARLVLDGAAGHERLFARALKRTMEARLQAESHTIDNVCAKIAAVEGVYRAPSVRERRDIAQMAVAYCNAISKKLTAVVVDVAVNEEVKAYRRAIDETPSVFRLSIEHVAFDASMIWKLPIEDLLTSEPVAPTLEAMRTDLRRHVAGQDEIIDKVSRLLAAQKPRRFVWLFSGAGAGKTLLATRLAATLQWRLAKVDLINPRQSAAELSREFFTGPRPLLLILNFADLGSPESQSEMARLLQSLSTLVRPAKDALADEFGVILTAGLDRPERLVSELHDQVQETFAFNEIPACDWLDGLCINLDDVINSAAHEHLVHVAVTEAAATRIVLSRSRSYLGADIDTVAPEPRISGFEIRRWAESVLPLVNLALRAGSDGNEEYSGVRLRYRPVREGDLVKIDCDEHTEELILLPVESIDEARELLKDSEYEL